MFYSHTFLARKGSLGTVWCAAHLQHRLKKSHYTSTDISSTVERIMYPEVPIALRMSGHLLLGVVRIYSKKVDYLYQDYNVFLISIRKAFASVDVNLPEDATHAPFHTVTLPDRFELEAWNLDDVDYEGVQDNHLRSQEEITLTDQIPIGRDPYITITIDEGVLRNPLRSEDASESGAIPMEEDAHPSIPVDATVGFQDPGLTNQTGVSERLNEDSFPHNIPDIEVMRNPVHDFDRDNILLWPDQVNDVSEPDKVLEQLIMNNKEVLTPAAEEILVSGGQFISSQQHGEPHISASDLAPDNFDSHISFGHETPELAIRSTPPVSQPKARPRKRKLPFDKAAVLTNKFIKAGLDNRDDLRRKRKCRPSAALDDWKTNNRLRKEKIFLKPLVTGLCADLCNLYEKDFIYAKPHLASVEEARPEPSVARSSPPMHGPVHEFDMETGSPPMCDPMPDVDMEIERLRNYDGHMSSNILPEIMGSPNMFMSSPRRRDDFTPISPGNLGSQSEPQLESNVGTGVQPTPDPAASTGTLGSETETPRTIFKERLGLENTGLSDIPEVMNSAEEDDLNFLAFEDYTPTESQRTQGVDIFSGTTRKVVQYLKGKYSVTPMSENLSGDLILNKLLEGKSRKVCARMFFETLVLKCCGLVDAHQEEPYDDITLKLTPKLFKDQV